MGKSMWSQKKKQAGTQTYVQTLSSPPEDEIVVALTQMDQSRLVDRGSIIKD